MLPLVLIPGIQGRWEYMRRTVDALSADFRVLTFSLRGNTMEDYASQVSRALDEHHIERAVICGVSFGGLVALRFAAASPERTMALVMVSTPAPGWHLRRRHQLYARLPWIFGPLFLAETPWRLRPEMAAALPDWRARWAFNRAALRTFITAPVPLSAMAARARLIERLDMRADCACVSAPTLVVTGEAHLDHVVPAERSSEYVQLIRGARGAVLEKTGHTGTMTRPEAFATLVRDFVSSQAGRTRGSAPTHGQVA
jgi:pimeloyl-ACP methyl ester carboxylesterase